MMSTYETLENAIEAARKAQDAIIQMKATKNTKATLDASYVALRDAIDGLSKLLRCAEPE